MTCACYICVNYVIRMSVSVGMR